MPWVIPHDALSASWGLSRLPRGGQRILFPGHTLPLRWAPTANWQVARPRSIVLLGQPSRLHPLDHATAFSPEVELKTPQLTKLLSDISSEERNVDQKILQIQRPGKVLRVGIKVRWSEMRAKGQHELKGRPGSQDFWAGGALPDEPAQCFPKGGLSAKWPSTWA